MKKYNAFIVLTVIMALVFTGCSGNAIEGSNAELVQEDSHEASSDASETKAVQGITLSENATIIELSDDEITVDGQIISTDADSAVYAGAEIVYYEEGHDETYGEGSSEQAAGNLLNDVEATKKVWHRWQVVYMTVYIRN